MLLAEHTVAQLFEAVMLICFGVSWPVAIYKTLRTRHVHGKSLLFLVLIFIGYLAGIAAKFITAAQAGTWPTWVTWLYAFNALMVAIEIRLYHKFRPRAAKPDMGEPTLP
jgi:hypothetical protein